ncbi:cupin [Pseudomonas fluorescens]|uniref:Cupin n=1 Tax=Pseudomonas fluorescens TaxID=294 RepID=A0A379ICG5_PSEFL|nr:cupin [Pseudomonas fluorescens]
MPACTATNFAHKYSLFNEQWAPKVIAQMNDYQFKVVKIEGDFVWHSHADTVFQLGPL